MYEVLYPADHDFPFLKIFRFGQHVDAVGPALRRQSVLQGSSPIHHFRTEINVSTFWSTLDSTVWDGGYLWHKVWYTAQSFICMAVYDLEIKIV